MTSLIEGRILKDLFSEDALLQIHILNPCAGEPVVQIFEQLRPLLGWQLQEREQHPTLECDAKLELCHSICSLKHVIGSQEPFFRSFRPFRNELEDTRSHNNTHDIKKARVQRLMEAYPWNPKRELHFDSPPRLHQNLKFSMTSKNPITWKPVGLKFKRK